MSYKIGYVILLLTVVSTGVSGAVYPTDNTVVSANTDINQSVWPFATTQCVCDVQSMQIAPINEFLSPARVVFVEAGNIPESAEQKPAEVSDRPQPPNAVSSMFIILMIVAAVLYGAKKKTKRLACVLSKY